jgi:hypothetical protein
MDEFGKYVVLTVLFFIVYLVGYYVGLKQNIKYNK